MWNQDHSLSLSHILIFRFLVLPASSISTITAHGDATFKGTPHYVRTIFIMKFDRLSFKKSRSAFQSAQYPRKAGCNEFCHRVDLVPSTDKFRAARTCPSTSKPSAY